jgi:hypothetical protein
MMTEEILNALVDDFAAGLSYEAAARARKISVRTFWRYMKISKADDPDTLIDFLGERIQFCRAVVMARKMVHLEGRSRFESRSVLGHDEPIFFQGQPSWVEEERAVGLDEDTRELLGYSRDGLKRDAAGNRIQHTLHHEPPVAAVLRLLEMSFPEEYRVTTNQQITNLNPPTQGATRGERPTAPPIIPPQPERPLLEVLPEPEDDPELNEMLGAEPEPDSEVEQVAAIVQEAIPAP